MKTEPCSNDEKLERERARVKVEHLTDNGNGDCDGDGDEEEGREDNGRIVEMVTVDDIVKEEHSVDEDGENKRLVGLLND